MADWHALREELDAWHAAGRTATLWWRDDDARSVTGPLERVLTLSAATDVPVALAVIPRDADEGLWSRLHHAPLAVALQHGWGHDNHAGTEADQTEYGPHRPVVVMLAELAAGADRIKAFPRSLPVLVAPWNRIDPALIPRLPEAGVAGLSLFGPRAASQPVPGLVAANAHVDIVDWCGSGGFVGLDRAIAQVVDHLSRRRTGSVDGAEPTGLMSHHAFHDEGCWWFVEELLHRTRTHPAVRWLDASEVFRPPG